MKGSNKLAETLIAVVGIWLVVSPIPDFLASIFSLSYFERYDANQSLFIGQLFFVSAKVLCGFLLILSRKKVVALLGLSVDVDSKTRSFLTASLFLLGVYFVMNGIVAFGQHYAVEQQANSSNPYLLWQGLFSVISGVLVVIFSPILGKFWAYLNRE